MSKYVVDTTAGTVTDFTAEVQKTISKAKQAGYEQAKHECEDCPKNGYENGLNDMWEDTKFLSLLSTEKADEIFPGADAYNRFNLGYSGVEAHKMIAAYKAQKKQEEQIQVGDEVENTQTGVRFIVTHTWLNNHGEKGVSGFNHDCSAFSTTIELVKKTGRHFPEIAVVLEKMREG